ncbi:MAG: GIY-YIG nuclease family protein [Candidatus Sungiibacteriota bacterium]
MWYVYILESKRDSDFYVGLTNDLRSRIEKHNKNQVFATKFRTPFALVYYEAHFNKNDAAAREQFLKTGWGKNWVQRTLKNYLESKKLGG